MSTSESIYLCLKIIGSQGYDGVSVVAPNATQALQVILKKSKNNIDSKKIISELRRQSLITATRHDRITKLTITPAGAHRLQKVSIDQLKIRTPKQWDKNWRVVTFDIPNHSTKSRVSFTQQLTRLGLKMMQKSIWVHPYPCFEEAEKIASYYNVRRYCSFFTITELDRDMLKKLKIDFNL